MVGMLASMRLSARLSVDVVEHEVVVGYGAVGRFLHQGVSGFRGMLIVVLLFTAWHVWMLMSVATSSVSVSVSVGVSVGFSGSLSIAIVVCRRFV